MTAHKLQHFVPQVYLRNFSENQNRKTICVWIANENKFISNAPIKSQCARSYLYGKDLVLERSFQEPEKWYSEKISKLLNSGSATREDLQFFLFFWLLQQQRGIVQLSQTVHAEEEVRHRAFRTLAEARDVLGPEISEEMAAKVSFADASRLFSRVQDLRCALLRNTSDTAKFVTSDNPAVSSNKFLQKSKKHVYSGQGLASAGLYVFMPLSPQCAFFAYDRDVYYVKRSEGRHIDVGGEDVVALNELVALNTHNCVYFDCANDRHFIEKSLKSSINRRLQKKIRLNLLVEDERGEKGSETTFRSTLDESEFLASRATAIHQEALYPIVRRHFPKLRFRNRKRYLQTGTAAGIVRARSKEP